MRAATPILASAGVATLVAALAITHPAAPTPITAQTVATTSPAPLPNAGPTVTVTGTGTVTGTPDQVTMSFAVEVTASTASAAYGGESAQANKLVGALRAAGVADSDIQTQWVSLYPDSQSGGFTASSSVSAVIHGIAHAGSVIDSAVHATGDSIRLEGISLSIADTSSLMASARAAAVHDAQAKGQQYAQAAGLKLGALVSIEETDATPRPIMDGVAAPQSTAQPIQAGQQTLQVSVTVVYQLAQ
jgi:uncharacterized protein YggE